ncbi:hypothetical protein WUBG_13655 [Wuchereria bancrofti]|uniref:Uncharacterized protein n=1 Tax=Wuchereria bancrofti TaxID=6293 RepID=J9DZZ5_WUCBA|nr:hypothetical protein WUBG_13655 [Wuchereria bancrofti]
MVVFHQMHSGKFYRSVRFILRRKPCLYLTGILSLSTIILALLLLGAIILYNSSVRELRVARREEKILARYINRIDFFHCSYNFSSEADIEQCNACGDASIVHLPVRTLTNLDVTCVDLNHWVINLIRIY